MHERLGAFAHLPTEARSASGPAAATRPGGLPLTPRLREPSGTPMMPARRSLCSTGVPFLSSGHARGTHFLSQAAAREPPGPYGGGGTLCPPPTPRVSQQLWGPSRSVAAQLSWAQHPAPAPWVSLGTRWAETVPWVEATITAQSTWTLASGGPERRPPNTNPVTPQQPPGSPSLWSPGGARKAHSLNSWPSPARQEVGGRALPSGTRGHSSRRRKRGRAHAPF